MTKIDDNRIRGNLGETEVNNLLSKIFYNDGNIQKTDTTYDKGVDFIFKFTSPIKNRYFSELIEIQVKTGSY